MKDFAALVSQGETGYISLFSITHFVAGWLWNLVGQWVGWGPDWLNLLSLATAALVFELAENSRLVSFWIWSRTLGRDGREYQQDTLENAIMDCIFAILGWTGVQLINLASPTLGARLGMLGAALVLLALFAVGIGKKPTEVAAPETFAAPPVRRVKFSLAI